MRPGKDVSAQVAHEFSSRRLRENIPRKLAPAAILQIGEPCCPQHPGLNVPEHRVVNHPNKNEYDCGEEHCRDELKEAP